MCVWEKSHVVSQKSKPNESWQSVRCADPSKLSKYELIIWLWVKTQIVPPVSIPIQPLNTLKRVVHRKPQNGIPKPKTVLTNGHMGFSRWAGAPDSKKVPYVAAKKILNDLLAGHLPVCVCLFRGCSFQVGKKEIQTNTPGSPVAVFFPATVADV